MPVIACSFNTGWTCRHLLEEGPAVPVTLPHDAALAEPRTETAPGGTNTGWYEGYDYLYEKRFTPDAALQGQTLVLEFEGVYHNAEVWLNGEKLAFNPYGYTDFKVDLTGKLDFDAENVLQVIARNAAGIPARASTARSPCGWARKHTCCWTACGCAPCPSPRRKWKSWRRPAPPAPCSCRCWTALPCWPVRPLRPESRCA